MPFTNQSILRLAMEQSAIDAHCSPEDFAREDNVVVTSVPDPRARKYLSLPFDCHLISYGSNIVASVSEPFREAAAGYIRRFPVEHCFETPALHVLEDAVREQGAKVCFMAEYFLPDLGALRPLDSPYPLKLLGPADFGPLYTGTWSNAFVQRPQGTGRAGHRGLRRRRAGRLCGLLGGLRGDVADRGGRPARLPAAGHCLGPHQPAGAGHSGAGQGPVLLCGVEQPAVGAQRHQKRVPPCLGGADRQKRRLCGPDERSTVKTRLSSRGPHPIRTGAAFVCAL